MGAKLKAAIITLSDTRTEANDHSGDTLENCLKEAGAAIIEKLILSDDAPALAKTLICLSARDDINLIITTGGTGFSPRDNTPEATREVIDREAPGLSEAMRAASMEKTPFAMLSRGVCGIRGNCLVINLPGSPKAVKECFEVIRDILPHAVNQISGIKEH